MSTKTIKYGTAELREEIRKEVGEITFGLLLESHRKSEELSQREFAKNLGISPSSLCDLEKGRKIPTLKRAAMIARQLGMLEAYWVNMAIQDQINEQGLDLKVSVV